MCVRPMSVRGPLPTLGGLLAQILDTSAKFPTEHGGADIDILHDDPQHVADIHRKIRSEKSRRHNARRVCCMATRGVQRQQWPNLSIANGSAS